MAERLSETTLSRSCVLHNLNYNIIVQRNIIRDGAVSRTVMRDDLSVPPTFVLKFYLYKGTLAQGFIVPITVEYVLWRGLSFSELGVLGSIFMVTWVASEVPTGYLGDRFGRKRLLFVSSGGTALVVFSLAWIGSFGAFALAYVGWALAVSLRSGVGSAWMYDLLKERLDEDAYARVTGRGNAMFLGVSAVTAIAGAQLATLDWQYPFIANAALLSLGMVVLYSMPASGRFGEADTGEDAEDVLTPRETVAGVWQVVARSPLRWFVLYTALFFGFVEVAGTFTQPVSTEIGITIGGLGWLYAGFNLVSAVASFGVGRIKETVGIRAYFVSAPVGIGILFGALAFVPILAIPAFFLVRAARAVANPLKRQYVNDRIGSTDRATVLSAATMVAGLAGGATRFAGGFVADVIGPILMLATFATGLLVLTLAMLLAVSPFGRRAAGTEPLVQSAGNPADD
jgi:MFS family permease